LLKKIFIVHLEYKLTTNVLKVKTEYFFGFFARSTTTIRTTL